MTSDELKEVLRLHGMWRFGEAGGVRADLRSADLRSSDLRSADLRFANLQFANLRSSDLRSANLQSANLRSANLRSANLRSSNLQFADLQFADLRSSDLQFANLRSANLRSANLQSADLRSSDLRSADLQSLNLQSATGDPQYIGYSVANLAWPVWISPDAETITIGCQSHSYDDWKKWTAKSKAIIAMHADAPAFWAKHKRAIMALADSVRGDKR